MMLNPMRRPAVEAAPLTIAVCIAAVIGAVTLAATIETAMTARIASIQETNQ